MRTISGIPAALLAVLLQVSSASAGDAKSDLEALAKTLHALDPDRIAFDRTGRRAGSYWPDLDAEQDHLVTVLREARYGSENLTRLLEHGDPKVRTLAAAALFAKEDPKALAPLVQLVDDEAETFPSLATISRALLNEPPPPPTFQKQTVGRVVKLLLDQYLGPAGVHGTSKRPVRDVAKQYFETRKSREWCASWFQSLLTRAHQGTSPAPADRIERMRALRARIDRVPMPDRAFLLAWIQTPERGGEAFASSEEIIALLRQVGSDTLVKVLQRKIPTDDPDLQPRPMNNYPYKRLQMLVLRNSRTLLRKEDAPALLACEVWENDYQKHEIGDPTQTPWWRIAAAELDPDRAKEILSPLWSAPWSTIPKWDHEGPADLALAWWRLCSVSNPEAVVAWFHDSRQGVGAYSSSRYYFLKGLGSLPRAEGKALAAALVRHPNLDKLDWGSMEVLCRLVNGWEPRPVVSEDELRRAWHPLGHHADTDMDAAAKSHPKETKELLARLAEWCTALRTWADN